MSAWKPLPALTLSEWADTYAVLSPESSAESGKWHSFPYQVGVMDAFTDSSISKITVKKSARVGYTKMLNHCLGYHIHIDPCPVLIVQPTIEDAQGHSKDEIAPMLRDTPCLDGLVADVRSKDSDNTILKKAFRGGRLYLVGANSARGFRRISARVILFDEVDAYPPAAGDEGDQIKLGSKRADWYWNKKIVLGSTPLLKGTSRIDASWKESDQRRFFVPCPFCGEFQYLKFGDATAEFGFKWPKGKPEEAAYMCEFCHELIPHSAKRDMVSKGEWRATKPFSGHAGFHIWAAYSFSPGAAWGIIAQEFLTSKKDPLLLQTWVNTVQGEVFEQKGTRPAWRGIANRKESYHMGDVPAGGLLLTAGIDTQDDRLPAIVIAWGEGMEAWVVLWHEYFGDPGQRAVWNDIDALLDRRFPHELGGELKISIACVDSGGHHTQDVYNYARPRYPVVLASKGSSKADTPIIGRPSKPDVNIRGKKVRGGVLLWMLGVHQAKFRIYQMLDKKEPGPLYMHFPAECDKDFFQQLTAEKLVTRFKGGVAVERWEQMRTRNDALDCCVMAYAAAMHRMPGINWDRLRKQVMQERQRTKKARTPKRDSWVGNSGKWV